MNTLARHLALSATAVLALVACSRTTSSTESGSTTTLDPSATSSSAASSSVAEATTTTVVAVTSAPESSAPVTTTAATAATAAPTSVAPTVPPTAGYVPMSETVDLVPSTGSAISIPVSAWSCDSDPGIPGWSMDQCGEQNGLAGLVLHRNDDGSRGVFVLRKVGANFVETHAALEPSAGEWDRVLMLIGDYAGVGRPALFIGYKHAGTGGYMDLDTVQVRADGSLELRGEQGLAKGNFLTPNPDPGALADAVFAPGDPACCPSGVRVRDIDFVDGHWSVDSGSVSTELPSWAWAF